MCMKIHGFIYFFFVFLMHFFFLFKINPAIFILIKNLYEFLSVFPYHSLFTYLKDVTVPYGSFLNIVGEGILW